MMNERSMYPFWKKYIEDNPPKGTEVYELKFVNLSKTKSFVFSHVDEHQIESLSNSTKGVFLRIMDQPWSNGGYQQRKLCDSLFVKAKETYVVPVFYMPRKYKRAFKIPINIFTDLKRNFSRKSIREEELMKVDGVSWVDI